MEMPAFVPDTDQIKHEIQIRTLLEDNAGLHRKNQDLGSLVSTKNAQIVRLEAENVRLKLDRTDSALKSEVAGLRAEVGAKDRKLIEQGRTIDTLREAETLALRRSADAKQQVTIYQTTLSTMQRARDAAQGAQATAEQARIDAIREMAIASDSARTSQERLQRTEPVVAAALGLVGTAFTQHDAQAVGALARKANGPKTGIEAKKKA